MVQTRAMATGVAIIGRMNTVRAKPRSGKLRWKHTAAATPSTTGKNTDSAVKYSVRTTDQRNRSSVGRRR